MAVWKSPAKKSEPEKVSIEGTEIAKTIVNDAERWRRTQFFSTDLAEIYRDDLEPDIDDILHLVRKNSTKRSRVKKLTGLFDSDRPKSDCDSALKEIFPSQILSIVHVMRSSVDSRESQVY
jgi:hypothetical protein